MREQGHLHRSVLQFGELVAALARRRGPEHVAWVPSGGKLARLVGPRLGANARIACVASVRAGAPRASLATLRLARQLKGVTCYPLVNAGAARGLLTISRSELLALRADIEAMAQRGLPPPSLAPPPQAPSPYQPPAPAPPVAPPPLAVPDPQGRRAASAARRVESAASRRRRRQLAARRQEKDDDDTRASELTRVSDGAPPAPAEPSLKYEPSGDNLLSQQPPAAPTGPSEQERALQAQVAALQAQLGRRTRNSSNEWLRCKRSSPPRRGRRRARNTAARRSRRRRRRPEG